MTLREITQRVSETQQLAEKDTAAALAKNRQLFVDLARQDEIYIVSAEPVSDDDLLSGRFRPYSAPAQQNDPRVFIRVFSHEDAASAFAEKHHGIGVHKIDGVELMQLSKYYFLRGLFGLLLNDGLAWAVISFPDFLSGCFQSILGDPALARPEYVALVEFINMVRQNEFYHLFVGHQVIKEADDPEKIFFLSPMKKDRFEGVDYTFEELTISKLLQNAAAHETAHVHIRTDKRSIQVSSSMLRAAFRATGLDQPESAPFYTDVDFHTNSIALDFRLSDFPTQDQSMLEGFQLAELPAPHEKTPDADESEKQQPFIDMIRERIRRLKRKPKDKDPAKENESQLQLKLPHLPIRKFAAGALGIALVAVIAAGGAAFLRPSLEGQLRKSISDKNYAEVSDRYDACIEKNPGSEDELLKEMAEDLNTQLTAYATDTISADELRAAIDGYGMIKGLRRVVESAYQTASALEQSKLAYEQGENEPLGLERLNMWRNVLKTDTGSQSKMAKSLELLASLYKTTVFQVADTKNTLDAIADLMLLQSFYPDDTEIADKIKTIQEVANRPVTGTPEMKEPDNNISSVPGTLTEPTPSKILTSPIFIQKLYAHNVGFDGRQDLCILWENTSGKEIKTVNFKVCAYDRSGEQIVTYLDNGDYYIYYIAEDTGSYEDGYSTRMAHTWTNVWNTSSLSSVQLDMVSIIYADGDIETIANTEDIQNLFVDTDGR